MKKVFKIIFGILLTIYLILTIIIVTFALSRNDYGISQIKNYSFVFVNSKNKNDNYKDGELLIIKKKNFNSIKTNDEIFVYKSDKNNNVYVTSAIVDKIDFDNSFVILKNEYGIFREDLILGKCVNKYKSIGKLFEALTKKNTYLILIIIPCALLVIFEFYQIIKYLIVENKKKIEE